MKKIALTLLMCALFSTLTACVVTPGGYYHHNRVYPAGPVWVPGHYSGNGYWVRGHWR